MAKIKYRIVELSCHKRKRTDRYLVNDIDRPKKNDSIKLLVCVVTPKQNKMLFIKY